jgi:mannitol/fructose-specific phosphotransferase system IIA component (Ntr-type)
MNPKISDILSQPQALREALKNFSADAIKTSQLLSTYGIGAIVALPHRCSNIQILVIIGY